MALSAGSRTGVPPFRTNGDLHRHELVRYLEQVNLGKINCAGEFTLTANVNTTTVNDTRAGASSFIVWSPLTANAAGEMLTMFVSARNKQSFVLTHANNANTDRTFSYVIIG